MVNLYYFSAAGNSLYAAKQLQEALVLNGRQVRLVSVAAAMQQRDFCPVGEVGFVMPLHFFGLPLLVQDFLQKVDFSRASYTFAVMTCGWHYMSDAFHALGKLLTARGGSLQAAYYVDMVSIYLPLNDIPPAAKTQQPVQIVRGSAAVNKDALLVPHAGSSIEIAGVCGQPVTPVGSDHESASALVELGVVQFKARKIESVGGLADQQGIKSACAHGAAQFFTA